MLKCLKLDLEEFNCLENYITRFSDQKLYSTFLLNVDKLSCENINEYKEVVLKYTIFNHNNNLKIALMFKFSGNHSKILGRVYDYKNKYDKENLEMLLFQMDIPLCTVKNNKVICSYVVENDFKDGIKEYILNRNKVFKYRKGNLEIKELWYNS